MKLDFRRCLLLLLVTAVIVSARKKKKDRKAPPQWKNSAMPFLKKVNEGMGLKLDCKASGHPKPSISWFKDGQKISSKGKFQTKKFSLIMKDLTTDNSGNYTCIVNNKHGQLEWTFHLDVQGEKKEVKIWPLVVEGPNNITDMAGSDVAFRCRVLNDPRATIRWQKFEKTIDRDEKSAPPDMFLPDSPDPEILMLKNIQKKDEGEYRCMAGNVWGLKYSSAWLSVIEPVIIPDFPTEMESTPGNFPPRFGNDLNTGDPNDPFFNQYKPGGMDNFDFGQDLYYTSTRKPKNRKNGGRRKNGRKKDRKGKDKKKNRMESTTLPMSSTTTTTTTTTTKSTLKNPSGTTRPEIWMFEEKEEFDGVLDTRYNPVTPKEKAPADTGNVDRASSNDNEMPKGSISSWTIYTIVGAVGGVILLVGLIAITLALCCKKEEGGVYKSTPV